MKRNKLIAVLAGAIALTCLGSASFAMTQTFSNIKQSVLASNDKAEFKMNALTPAEEAQQWQEMKQRLTDAGINLTPQQEATMRQAQRQLGTDMVQVFQDRPLVTIAQLIAAASLPQPQGEALMKTTRLDERLGNPLLTYRNSTLNALTPEQRPIWEQRIWQQQGQQSQPTDDRVTISTPTPAEQAQQWEQMKQRFRDASVPLTPEQETQMQAANIQLQSYLTQEFQDNPTGAFARFIAVTLLPAPITERFAEGLLGRSLLAHFQSVNQILTPEQQRVWDQGWQQQFDDNPIQ